MKEKNTSRPPKLSLWLRILCGGYLLYLAYGLLPSIQETPLYIAAVAVFALVGLVLAVHSIVKLCRREYAGADDAQQDDPNTNEEQSDEQ
jgi:hypothetical protein